MNLLRWLGLIPEEVAAIAEDEPIKREVDKMNLAVEALRAQAQAARLSARDTDRIRREVFR